MKDLAAFELGDHAMAWSNESTVKRLYLWRGVDDEEEMLEILVQSHRNKRAALKLMRNLLKKQGFVPDVSTTFGIKWCCHVTKQ